MTLLDLIRERMLQCGHGHEAVENGTGCEIVICDVALQCGHGHEAVENSFAWHEATGRQGASMRPRP